MWLHMSASEAGDVQSGVYPRKNSLIDLQPLLEMERGQVA